MILNPTFIAFDVETTGLDSFKNEIIELAGIKFSLENRMGKLECHTLSTFNKLVKPVHSIPDEITNINHITNEMVAEANDISVELPKFIRFCGLSSILLAHNAKFDIDFLVSSLKKNNLSLPSFLTIDSIKIAKKLRPEMTSYSLGNLARKMLPKQNLNSQNFHRALYDCEILRDIFSHMIINRFLPNEFTIDQFIEQLQQLHGPLLKFQ